MSYHSIWTGIIFAALISLSILSPAKAASFDPNYTAEIVLEPDGRGVVAIPDVLINCMDKPSPEGDSATGSFAIRNPHDRAFVVSGIRFELEGADQWDKDVFFTLNRIYPASAISREEPNPALSLAGYRSAAHENRAMIWSMIAGMDFIGARSVKYYSFLEALWLDEPPRDISLDMYITLRTAGIEGTVFLDADSDGYRSPGEVGIAGATVTLTDSIGVTAEECTTDYRGYYSFPLTPPGTYYVQATLPGGKGFGELGRLQRSGALSLQFAESLRLDIPAQPSGFKRSGLPFMKRAIAKGNKGDKANKAKSPAMSF